MVLYFLYNDEIFFKGVRIFVILEVVFIEIRLLGDFFKVCFKIFKFNKLCLFKGICIILYKSLC